MKQKNLVLMGIAVACGLVAAILTANMGGPPKVETIDLVVAKKDLTTGTAFTKENIEDLTMIAPYPKNAIPPEALPKIVTDKQLLIGKRLSRATHANEYFNVADVGNKTQILFEPGKDIMSLPMTAGKAAGGFVGPGSRVDIVASVMEGTKREVLTLLPDMHVLAVDGKQDLTEQTTFPEMRMVSFAVEQKQALLIALANQRNANLELLLRHPDAPKREYNYDKVLSTLKNLGDKEAGVLITEDKKDTKPEIKMVEVYVAKEDIAPNTEIDEELIKTKFELAKKPAEYHADAVSDMKPYIGTFKAFKTGVAKNAYVMSSMIGAQAIRGGGTPPEVTIDEKPVPMGPVQQQAVEIAPWPHAFVPPTPPEPRTRDVGHHTNKGSIVYRYRETGVDTNEWKLIAVLSTEEASAGKDPKDSKDPKAQGQ
ncbi:Flp pilus assembly protein CpaB [Gemmata sp.]|uniref:Flp pilus assembly protein CpaB n=1 Tax=Gemmata sp. TaxID=1914242 RepID=UPI003F708C35